MIGGNRNICLRFSSKIRHKTEWAMLIMLLVMKMTGVIYADVLFVLNVYITYALLMLTALFLGIAPERMRLFLASTIGGASSLFILIPEISTAFLSVLRVVLCLVFSVVAFGYNGVRQLIRQSAVFLAVNFLFAGLMFAVWYFVTPSAVYYNTGIVYFDIDTLSLVLTISNAHIKV